MDPFSLTVGILTLLGAGGTIGKALKKIITFNPSDVLLALNNEVNDLQIVVQNVSDLLHQHSKVTQAAQISSISFALEKSKRTLSTLESLIAYEFTTTTGKENELKLDRFAWFRQERKVLQIKNDIRDDRFRLLEALIVLTSSTSLGINARIRQLSFTVESVSLDIRAACGESFSRMQDLSSLVQGSLVSSTRQGSAHGGFHDEQRTAAPLDTNPICISQKTGYPSTDLALTRQPVPPSHMAPQLAKANSIRITRKACNMNCRCSCHKKDSLRSPKFLTTILGSIMVGYSAIPLVAQRCNDSSCKGRSTNITYTYAFPDWFISRVVYFNFKNEQLRGPELCLRVVRVRPYTSEVFLAVVDNREENAILQTKRLLLAGEASVLDVDPRGECLLSMAIRSGRFDVIDFLINAGSDIFYEDNKGVSPCTLAWRLLLDPKLSEEEDRRLRQYFHDDSQLVTFDLPDLTQAFLNISGKEFYNVLASTPRSAIDDTDSGGRTVLAWAAHQGDEDAVKALLACGADPDHKARAGLTPLHMSIYASTPDCLRLLLSAKADVDIREHLGNTALNLAIRGTDETDCSELLLAHGADIECKAKFDWKPLRLAAKYNRPRQLSLLLSKGANINASESDGTAALHCAIIYKSSAVVGILLNDPRIDYEHKLNSGFTIIHLAAQYTDFETLKVLEATDLSKIDLDAVCVKGYTALNIARWRRDENEDWANRSLEPCDKDPEAWYKAFKGLMNSILMSQGKDVLGDSESECSTCPSKSSVGDDPEGSEDQQDEQDEWYDTAEEGD